jgi:hypothetical protein
MKLNIKSSGLKNLSKLLWNSQEYSYFEIIVIIVLRDFFRIFSFLKTTFYWTIFKFN